MKTLDTTKFHEDSMTPHRPTHARAYNSSASVMLTSTASWTCGSTSRVLAANGVPDHAVGTFPNAGNPNTIAAITVAATYTLSPSYTGTKTTLGGPAGVTGYVLNGLKIDAGTAGSCNNSGSSCSLIDNSGGWSIEALGQSSFNFGTDANNAHVQPGGSYQLVTTANSSRPSTTTYALGTFAQNWQYVAGSGDLDECNGRTGVTPEFPNGIYHYYATDTYPFLQRCVKGAVTATGP